MGVVAGLCAICQSPGALHSCALCGRVVCSRHFQHGAGTCTAHARGGGGPLHGRT